MARAAGDAASGYDGNKGRECAAAAVEMIGLLAAIETNSAQTHPRNTTST
jgi:hypothetical protein